MSNDGHIWDVSVNVTMYNDQAGGRFNVNHTYKIPITEFATLDALTRAVNKAVREFVPDDE